VKPGVETITLDPRIQPKAMMNTPASFPTIVHQLRAAIKAGPTRPAFRYQQTITGSDTSAADVERQDKRWTVMTWGEYGDQVEQLATRFLRWGVAPGDRIAILSENCWQWHVSDMAALTIGAVTVPIYPTSSPSQIGYLLQHSAASLCVVGKTEQFAKILAATDEVSSISVTLRRVIRIATDPRGEPEIQPNGIEVFTWDQAYELGNAKQTTETVTVDARFRKLASSDLATIVYTSGTTGPPKGVMLTHRNITETVRMVCEVVPLGPTDRFLSFLPLSHIAERVVSNFGHIASGGETWFARSFSTVSKDILDCKPTVFFAVPRVWEKVREAFEIRAHELDPVRKQLVRRYQQCAAGSAVLPNQRHRSWLDPRRVEFELLDRTIGHSIRSQIGLAQARALYSGAAPIDPDLLRWLQTIGLHVGEVYGQTEVCGPTSVAAPESIRIGTVGRPLPGVEVQIDPEDSKILVRGPNVCPGYFHNNEATQQLFDSHGWMRSGDLGTRDGDGYLRITGRKKDLMKTALGKYVAPQELEMRLRSCRFIANAVVIAEGRPFISALLTLDAEAVGPWAQHRNKPLSIEALSLDPDVLSEVRRQVDEVNLRMSPPERVRSWRVLPRDFTVNDGELTPTLKVVRTTVMAHFPDDISAVYATQESHANTTA
jgi:long-chain acyl-CoA synthetase